MPQKILLDSIEIVAMRLGDLNEQVAFVGGSVANLYIDDLGGTEVRETEDVDCVVEVASLLDFESFKAKLKERGFNEDPTPRAPICRWIIGEIKVDVMPQNDIGLGFSNPWYPLGLSNKEKFQISENVYISIFPLPYFLASKLVAQKARGGSDLRFDNHDLEDIVIILDGCKDPITKIKNADEAVVKFLSSAIKELRNHGEFDEMVDSYLKSEGLLRIERVRRIFEQIASL